ncbi:MAG: WxL domain-containing protein [Lactobacillus sp.]|jgi:hypothetical protein|nr:WxL domain-containing protein [Lactobacillus sp.]MCI2031847.1 WxL domain-containing protein [Lactobacillus sp.]
MKPALLWTGALTLAGAVALTTTHPVAAADAPAQTTKATIDVTSNKDGALTLTKAPNFNFNATTLSALSGKINGTADAVAEVSDTRDSGAGWQLNMSLGNFDATGSSALLSWSSNSTTYAGAGNKIGGDAQISNTTQVNAGDTNSAPVMDAGTGAGIGTWDLAFNNVGLTLSGINLPKTYTADVNWYLTDAQTTSNPD